MSCIIGIDPGKKGGVAIMYLATAPDVHPPRVGRPPAQTPSARRAARIVANIELHETPLIGNEYDVRGMAAIIGGVKASVVFLRKRATGETPSDDEAIFMAAPEKIGYDATGRKCENQLPEVIEQYREFEKNPQPFFV